MIPKHLASTWKTVRAALTAGRADEAFELLRILGGAPAEAVREMRRELVGAICHPLLAARREQLFAAFAKGPCFPLHRPSWKVVIVTRKGTKDRYVRNDAGEVVEVCRLGASGKPGLPLLQLDPVRRRGHVRFRSTEDSFGGGRAVAGTMYSDEPLEAEMSYQRWRDAYLKWFEE